MKKLFLSLVVAVAGTMSSFAQSDLVATLSHGSNLATYSGINALTDAYTAAEDGDVITLSSGTFEAINIEKAITLRGAGMNLLGVEPTILSGADITITIPDNAVSTPTIEGIHFTNFVSIVGNDLAPIHLLKCRFYRVGCKGCNAELVHCIVSGVAHKSNAQYGLYLDQGNIANAHFIESVVFYPTSNNSQNFTHTMQFDNCIIIGSATYLSNSTLKNCILWMDPTYSNTYYKLPASSIANYCMSNYTDTFNSSSGNNNVNVTNDMSLIFKTLRPANDIYPNIITKNYNETFELTDETAATYLGDDGKQLGIYGGTNPFDPTPTNPQVKKFTVDSSTNNGKLSVTINVE